MQDTIIYTPIGFSAEQVIGLALQLSWAEKRQLALLLWKELSQKGNPQEEILQQLTNEPMWNSESIEHNYVFNREAVIGQLPAEEPVELLISMLKK